MQPKVDGRELSKGTMIVGNASMPLYDNQNTPQVRAARALERLELAER